MKPDNNDCAKDIHALEEELFCLTVENKWLRKELEKARKRAEAAETSYATIENSKFWKITGPARTVFDRMKGVQKAEITDISRAYEEKLVIDDKYIYKKRYKLEDEPKISIIIPNCDHIEDLRKCLKSIEEKSTYANYEIVVVENNSKDDATFEYYRQLEIEYSNIKVVYWPGEFNFAAINNYGVKEAAAGEHILLMNNDTEVITPDWMQEMLIFSQRSDVGAVGAMLYYPDGTIQHAGARLDRELVAVHIYCRADKDDDKCRDKLCYARAVSAVTGACMMIRRDVWDIVGGMDEDFPVAFNDIDLCMKIREKGYLIVWTPFAELYHYESKSRGRDDESDEKNIRLAVDQERFKRRWRKELDEGDPYCRERE